MKNKIEDLRNHLFSALEALADKDDPMDLERARAISDVSQTLINSAKVEVDYLKTVGATSASVFFPGDGRKALPPARAVGDERNS